MPTELRLPATPGELTVPALLLRNAEDHPELPALSWRRGDGWETLSWAEVRTRVLRLAAGFAGLGVRRGEHVLLMLANRSEHWLSDLALVHLGAVPVSVYGTAAPEQIAYIARHSRARLAVLEGPAEVARWEHLLGGASELERLVVAEPGTGHLPFEELDGPPEPVEQTWRGITASDPLTVVYTSGTTGDPKAVLVTHHNVMLNAFGIDQASGVPDHAPHIAYLPFAHIAERLLGLYLPVVRAGHVHLCADPGRVAETLREVRPPQFFGVPRVWEKLTSAVRAALGLLPDEQQQAVAKAGQIAREYFRQLECGGRPESELAVAYSEVREKVLTPLLARCGLDRVVWAGSAAAPMPVEVTEFWAGLGVYVNDAWGLSETAGVCTMNGRAGFKLGSVGRPLDGLEVRCAADGEVLVRGAIVSPGYLRADGSLDPLTDADGWFATGDLGRLDADGYLWITDRKKELIVTSTGKNVSPALVENRLKAHPLIGQALVHGDGRSYLVALLVLDGETAPAWAAARGLHGQPAGHPEVLAEVERAVAAANARLNRTEQVKRYRVLSGEWSPESGELTPSMKLKRRVVVTKYAAELDALYRN